MEKLDKYRVYPSSRNSPIRSSSCSSSSNSSSGGSSCSSRHNHRRHHSVKGTRRGGYESRGRGKYEGRGQGGGRNGGRRGDVFSKLGRRSPLPRQYYLKGIPTLYVPRNNKAVSSSHPQIPIAGACLTFDDIYSSAAAAKTNETLETRQSSSSAGVPQQAFSSKEPAVESASALGGLEKPIAGPSYETISENIISATELEEKKIEDASQCEEDVEQNPLEEKKVEEGEGLDGRSEEEKAASGSKEVFRKFLVKSWQRNKGSY